MQRFGICPFLVKGFLVRFLENCGFVERKGGRPHTVVNCAAVFCLSAGRKRLQPD